MKYSHFVPSLWLSKWPYAYAGIPSPGIKKLAKLFCVLQRKPTAKEHKLIYTGLMGKLQSKVLRT